MQRRTATIWHSQSVAGRHSGSKEGKNHHQSVLRGTAAEDSEVAILPASAVEEQQLVVSVSVGS